MSFIDKHRSDPFFLYVPYNAPHWPFQPPNRPQDVRDKESYGPRNGTRADYIQMVREMDRGVGRILRALDAAEVAKNTLVIFTNDNGGERFSDIQAILSRKVHSLGRGDSRSVPHADGQESFPEALSRISR